MLCAVMIFTTVTTLLRHLARAQKQKNNLRSQDLRNSGKETVVSKTRNGVTGNDVTRNRVTVVFPFMFFL